jgi:mono/diheme cytochrome c family protein
LKQVLPVFAVIVFAAVSVPLLGRSQQEGAPTPEATPVQNPPAAKPAAARNPVKPTAESQTKAKNLYQIDCAICHGENGSGKTDVATSLGVTLGDWTDPKTLSAKDDGELFNMIRNGKDKMPAEAEGRAKDNEVWNLVIYLRSFSKAQASAAK